jgi:glycosyltransferase involved in cell wall biosynthesis
MSDQSQFRTGCRVWILNHYARPPDRPGGTRHFSLARELLARGGDVTIFAASFGHASGRDLKLSGLGLVRSERIGGVRFVWLRTFPYRGNTWRRMVNMASYALVVTLAQIGRPAPDVVVGSTVHPFAALAGWVIARLRGARFVYEIRDLWPQTLIDLGAMSPASPVARGLWAIESFLVRRAETVIALLPGVATYLESRGLPADHVVYLPNGADLARADAAGAGSATPPSQAVARILAHVSERRAAGEVVFAYAGAHGLVNRLDVVVRGFALASERKDGLRLLLVGDGPEKPALERLVAGLDLRNVDFFDALPRDQIQVLLRAIDVGVVHARATPVYRYGVSFNKVFDYMAARKPILFACTTFGDPIEASGCGISIPPDDPALLADGFVAMADETPERRRAMGEAGRSFVEREHDLAKLGATFAKIVHCDGQPRSPG